MKAAETLHEGDIIIIRWKTSRFTRLYRTVVLKVEGNIVALEPIYDKLGIVPFDRGVTELIPVGEETVYQNLHVTLSHLNGKDIYLVSGHSEGSIYTEHRKFVRFTVNMKCSIGNNSAILADISSGGFRVVLKNDYPIGAWLKLNEYFDVPGLIVRKSKVNSEMFSYGCQVLDPNNAFLNFVTAREAEGAPVLN
ncbi:PilZ domain-containing protein [Lachnospiraceae bacterium]|nr:PilZ domain-containing protein [Lachnospiraceae bacterium]